MWRADESEAGRVADRLALVGAEGRILRRWPETARRLSGADFASGTTTDEVARRPRGAAPAGGARCSRGRRPADPPRPGADSSRNSSARG
jgi:hypothetical protein